MLKDSGLAKKYSVEGVMLELEKFREVTLAGGQVTRKQITIMEAPGIMRLISPGV